ncbi:hypothetical protein DASC09_007700 [Saccharomycopsis crataegensis]|uniref:Uncharacterized protein n=1 Tax=Saccharomycopsis crataegensis TaxID=43959 RepID=A0AAV5QER1_9ASCO|nr:hypothetical protein DASC09_007700 [Saccharomycopsis crataegensis]
MENGQKQLYFQNDGGVPEENIDFLLNTRNDDKGHNAEDIDLEFNSFALEYNLMSNVSTRKFHKKTQGKSSKTHTSKPINHMNSSNNSSLKDIFDDLDIDIDDNDEDDFNENDMDDRGRPKAETKASKPISKKPKKRHSQQPKLTPTSNEPKNNGKNRHKPRRDFDIAKFIDDKLNESSDAEDCHSHVRIKTVPKLKVDDDMPSGAVLTRDNSNVIVNASTTDESNRYQPKEDVVYKRLKDEAKKRKNKRKEKTKRNKKPSEPAPISVVDADGADNGKDSDNQKTGEVSVIPDNVIIPTGTLPKSTVEDNSNNAPTIPDTVKFSDNNPHNPSNDCDFGSRKVDDVVRRIDRRIFSESLTSDFIKDIVLHASPSLQTILKIIMSGEVTVRNVRGSFFRYILRIIASGKSPMKILSSLEFEKVRFITDLPDLQIEDGDLDSRKGEYIINFEALKYFGFITLWIIHMMKKTKCLRETGHSKNFFTTKFLTHSSLQQHKEYLPHIWSGKIIANKRVEHKVKELTHSYPYDEKVFVLILRCLKIKFDSKHLDKGS